MSSKIEVPFWLKSSPEQIQNIIEAMSRLDISIYDNAGNFKNFKTILQEIYDKFEKRESKNDTR